MILKEMFLFKPIRSFLILLMIIVSVLGATIGNYILTFGINELKIGNLYSFTYFMLSFAGLVLLGFLANTLAQFSYLKLVQSYFHELRSNYVRKLYHSGQKESVSEMQNRLTNDFEIINRTFSNPFLDIVIQGLTLIASSIAIFTFHWSLLLLILFLAVVMMIMPSLLSKKFQKATAGVSNSNNLYLKAISRWLGGITELRRYSAKNKLIQTMSQSSHTLETSKVDRGAVASMLNVLNLTMNVLSQLLVIALSGFLIIKGYIAFGVILSSGQFASIIFNGVVSISNSIGSVVSAGKLNKKLIAEMHYPDTGVVKDQYNFKNFAAIKTNALSIDFKNGESIHFPDISINNGEKVLLTGDSGSGKSTLIKILTGELKPKSGSVTYFDKNDKQIEVNEADFSYLPQNVTLFPSTITNNITMFNNKLKDKVSRIVNNVSLDKDINKFKDGLDTPINLDDLTLSGGQQQKIVLGRAEIHNKPLLFIDEGTSAIDRKGTIEILGRLLNSDKTIIFIAHNFDEELTKMFDRIISLDSN